MSRYYVPLVIDNNIYGTGPWITSRPLISSLVHSHSLFRLRPMPLSPRACQCPLNGRAHALPPQEYCEDRIKRKFAISRNMKIYSRLRYCIPSHNYLSNKGVAIVWTLLTENAYSSFSLGEIPNIIPLFNRFALYEASHPTLSRWRPENAASWSLHFFFNKIAYLDREKHIR